MLGGGRVQGRQGGRRLKSGVWGISRHSMGSDRLGTPLEHADVAKAWPATCAPRIEGHSRRAAGGGPSVRASGPAACQPLHRPFALRSRAPASPAERHSKRVASASPSSAGLPARRVPGTTVGDRGAQVRAASGPPLQRREALASSRSLLPPSLRALSGARAAPSAARGGPRCLPSHRRRQRVAEVGGCLRFWGSRGCLARPPGLRSILDPPCCCCDGGIPKSWDCHGSRRCLRVMRVPPLVVKLAFAVDWAPSLPQPSLSSRIRSYHLRPSLIGLSNDACRMRRPCCSPCLTTVGPDRRAAAPEPPQWWTSAPSTSW